MALPLAPVIYAIGGAAAGAAGGMVVERIINPDATRAEYVAAGAVGAVPGAGLGMRGAFTGIKQLRTFGKLMKEAPPRTLGDLGAAGVILMQKGTKFPYASGRPLVQPVIMGGAVSYIATAAYGKLVSRGGEHTASGGTPGTKARKTMRGPLAQKRAKRSGRSRSAYFRRDEERYR